MGVVFAGVGSFSAFFAEDAELFCLRAELVSYSRFGNMAGEEIGCDGMVMDIPGLRTARHSSSLRLSG